MCTNWTVLYLCFCLDFTDLISPDRQQITHTTICNRNSLLFCLVFFILFQIQVNSIQLSGSSVSSVESEDRLQLQEHACSANGPWISTKGKGHCCLLAWHQINRSWEFTRGGGARMISPEKRKKNKLNFFKHFQIHLQLKIYSHFINGITVKLLQRSTRLINSRSAGHDSPSEPKRPISPSTTPKKLGRI